MFDVNFKDIVNKLLPLEIRKEPNQSILYALVKPLQTLNESFVIFRNAINYKLLFNAQVIYLEHFLNDLYDPINRGIYIEDTADIEYTYLFNKSENRPVYIYNKSEGKPKFYLYNKQEYGGLYEYIIMVPVGISFNELLMRKQVNIYNNAGRRYLIKTF